MREAPPEIPRTGRPAAGLLILLPLLLAALGLLLGSCTRARGGGGGGGGGDDDDTGPVDDDDFSESCTPDGATACDGWLWMECDGGQWTLAEECVPPTPICHDSLGCVECGPGTTFCDGNSVMECDPDGMGATWVEDCPDDAPCIGGVCQDPCTQAASQFSYLGCEFLAVSTANLVAVDFDQDFAVVVGNPETATAAASVTVSRGGSAVATRSLQPGETSAIELPMVTEVSRATESVTVTDAAYEIISTLPIVAYQYNPLHFEIGFTYSYSNDASLLLPVHNLTGDYRVSSRPTFGVGQYAGGDATWLGFQPGFLAVAATADDTTVTLEFAGRTHSGNPGAHSAGQSTTVTLDRGDVVQVFGEYADAASLGLSSCSDFGWTQSIGTDVWGQEWMYCLDQDSDLTGTTVQANAQVAVFSGHQCSFVPFDNWACDHLEEMMFPTATWGDFVVMSAPRFPSSSAVATTKIGILALNGGTTVEFDPSVNGTVTLDAGEFIEFETAEDFTIQASDKVYVSQTMLGQDALGADIGDPAMGSGIPWQQVRSSYDFLTPSTYTENFVNVVAATGTEVLLDGSVVGGWEAIGGTGFSVARVALGAGSHHMEASDGVSRFGITTYGYASYTSYLYPGGLNFIR